MNIEIQTNHKFFTFLLSLLLYSGKVMAQLSALYSMNGNTCDCINIVLSNKCQDTVYVIGQSNSIHYWDSCFAYTVFESEKFKSRYGLDISYYARDFDYSPSGIFYILPNTTYKFGARSNTEMVRDSLFISMYVYAMPVKKGESTDNIKYELQKLKKTKIVRAWGWRSYFCSRKESEN